MLLNAYTRLFSRWAKHLDHGVNALLPRVPRHGKDPAVPGQIDILDDVDSPAVQLDWEPDGQRSLILCVEDDITSSVNRGRGQEEQQLVLGAFYMVKDVDVETGRQEGEYVLEATEACFLRLNERVMVEAMGRPEGSTDGSYRQYARVSVVEMLETIAMRVKPGARSAKYVGALFMRWKGRRIPLKLP